MIYVYSLLKGVSGGRGGGLNLDHCTLNHPKISGAQKKIDERRRGWAQLQRGIEFEKN
jgi:hypothetical protein